MILRTALACSGVRQLGPSVPTGQARLAGKRPDEFLGARRLEMLREPAVIGDLLRMAWCEVCRAADMARIRRAASVAAPECVCDAAVVNRSSVAALPCRQEFPVPAGGW